MLIIFNRCRECGKTCKENSYNKFIVSEIPETIFQGMLKNGLTCEDVFIHEDNTYITNMDCEE